MKIEMKKGMKRGKHAPVIYIYIHIYLSIYTYYTYGTSQLCEEREVSTCYPNRTSCYQD